VEKFKADYESDVEDPEGDKSRSNSGCNSDVEPGRGLGSDRFVFLLYLDMGLIGLYFYFI
jgi:hypothetical protein